MNPAVLEIRQQSRREFTLEVLIRISGRLKEVPRSKFPFKAELSMREELAKILDSHIENPNEGLTKVLAYLSGQLDSMYAYRRAIARVYYSWFVLYKQENSFDKTVEVKNYYPATFRRDNRWVYCRIYPRKRLIQYVEE